MPLPPIDEVAAMLPEQLAPIVLQDLFEQYPRPTERAQFHIGNYSGHFEQLGQFHRNSMRDTQWREPARQSLTEALAYLQQLGFIAPDSTQMGSGWMFITRRGREAAASAQAFASGRVRALFPAAVFHEALRGAPYDALIAGNFQQAVADAFRAVEVGVRDASGLAGNGVALMRNAFHETTGPLRSHAADPAEKQGLSNLFAGAFGWLRNAVAHRDVPLNDVTAAVEQLMLASLLLRIVDQAAPRP